MEKATAKESFGKESSSFASEDLENMIINLDKKQIVEILEDPEFNEICQNYVRGIVKERIDKAKEKLILPSAIIGSVAVAALLLRKMKK